MDAEMQESLDMCVASTDPMEQFERECRAKDLKGLMEHRGGDESLPYTGGPTPTSYKEEQLDSVNYLRRMCFIEHRISIEEYEYQFRRHFEAYWWMSQVEVRG